MDTLLKKPEILRDENGRFDRHGKELAKTSKNTMNKKIENIPEEKRGPGRPPGSLNRVTVALKEAILQAGQEAGGEEGLVGYLKMLARDNSSAFAGLLGKVLPATLTAESDGGVPVVVFRREIVHVHQQPASPQLPRPDETVVEPKDIKDL